MSVTGPVPPKRQHFTHIMVPSQGEGNSVNSDSSAVASQGLSSVTPRPGTSWLHRLNVAFGQTDNNDDGSGTVYHGWDNNDDSGEIFPQQLQQIVVNIKAEDRPAHLTSSLSSDEQRAAIIASCFLKDYEEGRPPTLSSDLDCITDQQLEMYHFKHSFHWKICSLMATLMLFLGNSSNRILTICLQMSSVLLFGVDLHMKYVFFQKTNHSHMSTMSIQSFRVPSPRRKIRAEQWLLHAVAAFLALFTIQSWAVFLFLDDLNLHWSTLIVSLFKPTVFFYQSRRARDALEALCRVGKKLLRVILVELFLILTFAAVACRLYANDDSFQNLARSWISLFALSTTVVNPGIWMPAYSNSRYNAIFFVTFIVVGVFYLHSLVLSVVFQVFIQSATEVHRRSISEKEQSLRLAFSALTSISNRSFCLSSSRLEEDVTVNPEVIQETVKILRPHYAKLKIKVIMDMLLPPYPETGEHLTQQIDFLHFRGRIRRVLTSSIRMTRSSHTALGLWVEILSVSTAIMNFIYVILVSSNLQSFWFLHSEFVMGSFITLLALLEALLRYNPLKFAYRINPMSRLNAILDGTGAIGSVISLFGVALYVVGNHSNGMELLLTGRAIGMLQGMRFSVWFREVLQRSLHVLPLLSGPLFLVLSTIHVFVCIGMAIWGGAINVEELAVNENVEPLFYLNNMNSYAEGCITIFNVLVVNDWHQIANVFRYASRCSNPIIVYSYFVVVVIVAVCIMVNVVVAFFVETFVTQLNLVDMEDDVHAGKRNLLSFDASELNKMDMITKNCSQTGETLQFDIIKREGYDEIMEMVANQTSSQSEAFAKSQCDTMEALASVTGYNTGHLFCCRQNLSHFHTKIFQELTRDFLLQGEIHALVVEMNECLSDPLSFSSDSPNKSLTKEIMHPQDPSQILRVTGLILPNNDSIVVLTVTVKNCG